MKNHEEGKKVLCDRYICDASNVETCDIYVVKRANTAPQVTMYLIMGIPKCM